MVRSIHFSNITWLEVANEIIINLQQSKQKISVPVFKHYKTLEKQFTMKQVILILRKEKKNTYKRALEFTRQLVSEFGKVAA